jgi:hypothetical protein
MFLGSGFIVLALFTLLELLLSLVLLSFVSLLMLVLSAIFQVALKLEAYVLKVMTRR